MFSDSVSQSITLAGNMCVLSFLFILLHAAVGFWILQYSLFRIGNSYRKPSILNSNFRLIIMSYTVKNILAGSVRLVFRGVYYFSIFTTFAVSMIFTSIFTLKMLRRKLWTTFFRSGKYLTVYKQAQFAKYILGCFFFANKNQPTLSAYGDMRN